MFVIGTKSMMFAISILPHLGLKGTVTISEEGAIPKVHWSIAPIHTKFPIYLIIYYYILLFISQNNVFANLTLRTG